MENQPNQPDGAIDKTLAALNAATPPEGMEARIAARIAAQPVSPLARLSHRLYPRLCMVARSRHRSRSGNAARRRGALREPSGAGPHGCRARKGERRPCRAHPRAGRGFDTECIRKSGSRYPVRQSESAACAQYRTFAKHRCAARRGPGRNQCAVASCARAAVDRAGTGAGRTGAHG